MVAPKMTIPICKGYEETFFVTKLGSGLQTIANAMPNDLQKLIKAKSA